MDQTLQDKPANVMSRSIRWDELFSYDTLVHALSGATGSTVAMTVFYPLDTVKIRLQVEEHRKSKGTFAVMKELVQEEGVSTLYRGLEPLLQSLWCSNFVYFYAFHGLRGLFTKDVSQHSAGRDLLIGYVAGVANVLTTTPLWVVNTRMKMQGVKLTSQDSEKLKLHPEYQNLIHGLYLVAKNEGYSALWSSTVTSLILAVNPAIQYMLYEALKRRAVSYKVPLNSLSFFLIGAFSKCLSTVVTYPLQVVQAKLRFGSEELKRKTLLKMMLFVIKKQGVLGLYRGMEAKLLQTVLTAALMLVAYEKIAMFVFILMHANQLRKAL